MDDFGVILFHTSSAAIQAEAALARLGLKVKLIPTPRELSSDCGISLRFLWKDREVVEAQKEKSGLDYAGVHPQSGGGKK